MRQLTPPLCRATPFMAVTVVMLAALLIAGCTPRGQSSGRIGVTETHPDATTAEGALLPVALIEFSDEAAERLVHDLSTSPQLNAVDGRATVFIGDFINETQRVPTSEFEVAVSRMRNRLLQSSNVHEKIRFVERRGRMERLSARERVASDGYLADPEDYDPASTFALNGEFRRINRGSSNYYYLEFQLVNFATNEIGPAYSYEVHQITQ